MTYGTTPKPKKHEPVPQNLEALREKLDPLYTGEPALPARLSTGSLNATYARFVDENGNPLTSRHVVIKVDSTTGEILDIVAEA